MKDILNQFAAKSKALKIGIEKLQAEARKDSQEIIEAMFKEFFAKHGEDVYAIWCHQYTPYFNDGGECTFRVGDIYIAFSEEGYEDEGEGDIFDRKSDYEEHLAKIVAYENDPQTAYAAYVEDHNRRYPPEKYRTYGSYYQPQSFASYKPSYYDKEDLVRKLEFIADNSKLERIIEDFELLKGAISSIPDEYLKMIYDDHVEVRYEGPDGTLHVDEYSHD